MKAMLQEAEDCSYVQNVLSSSVGERCQSASQSSEAQVRSDKCMDSVTALAIQQA